MTCRRFLKKKEKGIAISNYRPHSKRL